MILETYSKFIGGGSYMHEPYDDSLSLIKEDKDIMNNFYQLLYENNNNWFEIKTLLDLSDEIVHENGIVINESFSVKEIVKKIIEKIKNFFRKLKELFLSVVNAIKKKFKSQKVKKDCQEIRKKVKAQRNSDNTIEKSSIAENIEIPTPRFLGGEIRGINSTLLNLIRYDAESLFTQLYENLDISKSIDDKIAAIRTYCVYLDKNNNITENEEYKRLIKECINKQYNEYAEEYRKALNLLCKKFDGLDRFVTVKKDLSITANNEFFSNFNEYIEKEIEYGHSYGISVLDALDIIENVDEITSPLEKFIRNMNKAQDNIKRVINDAAYNFEGFIKDENLIDLSIREVINFFTYVANVRFGFIIGTSRIILNLYTKMTDQLYTVVKKM